MQAIAHNPKFAKKVGVAQSVGKEFEQADKAEGKFQKGKTMKESIQQFIKQLSADDKESAATTFQQIIADKVASRIEDMKIDVANQYFNGTNEAEIDEAVNADDACDQIEKAGGTNPSSTSSHIKYYNRGQLKTLAHSGEGVRTVKKSELDSHLKALRTNEEVDEAAYSAKAAAAGKDIGEPGKNFEKIADKAAEKYGSEEKGKKVAGAILKKIRAKHGIK